MNHPAKLAATAGAAAPVRGRRRTVLRAAAWGFGVVVGLVVLVYVCLRVHVGSDGFRDRLAAELSRELGARVTVGETGAQGLRSLIVSDVSADGTDSGAMLLDLHAKSATAVLGGSVVSGRANRIDVHVDRALLRGGLQGRLPPLLFPREGAAPAAGLIRIAVTRLGMRVPAGDGFEDVELAGGIETESRLLASGRLLHTIRVRSLLGREDAAGSRVLVSGPGAPDGSWQLTIQRMSAAEIERALMLSNLPFPIVAPYGEKASASFRGTVARRDIPDPSGAGTRRATVIEGRVAVRNARLRLSGDDVVVSGVSSDVKVKIAGGRYRYETVAGTAEPFRLDAYGLRAQCDRLRLTRAFRETAPGPDRILEEIAGRIVALGVDGDAPIPVPSSGGAPASTVRHTTYQRPRVVAGMAVVRELVLRELPVALLRAIARRPGAMIPLPRGARGSLRLLWPPRRVAGLIEGPPRLQVKVDGPPPEGKAGAGTPLIRFAARVIRRAEADGRVGVLLEDVLLRVWGPRLTLHPLDGGGAAPVTLTLVEARADPIANRRGAVLGWRTAAGMRFEARLALSVLRARWNGQALDLSALRPTLTLVARFHDERLAIESLRVDTAGGGRVDASLTIHDPLGTARVDGWVTVRGKIPGFDPHAPAGVRYDVSGTPGRLRIGTRPATAGGRGGPPPSTGRVEFTWEAAGQDGTVAPSHAKHPDR